MYEAQSRIHTILQQKPQAQPASFASYYPNYYSGCVLDPFRFSEKHEFRLTVHATEVVPLWCGISE